MSLLIIIGIYCIAFYLVSIIGALELSAGLEFIVGITAGIGALILPLAVYSVIDNMYLKKVVEKIGKQWCDEKNTEYIKVDIFKNHFALIYKEDENKQRKKFRIHRSFLTWKIIDVKWL